MSTLFTFIGVLSTTITFVFVMFILRPICLLSSDSSCSICCSSCGVSVHRNMSSAKRRLERNSPSIFTPLFSQFNLLNMLSNVAVNSLGEMVSPCLTPLLILIFSLSLFVLSLTNIRIIKFVNLYKIDHLIETITSSITIIIEVYAHQICKTPLFVKVLLAQSYEAHPFTKALLAQSYERRLLQRHYSRRRAGVGSDKYGPNHSPCVTTTTHIIRPLGIYPPKCPIHNG